MPFAGTERLLKNRIRDRRIEHGLTQDELGARASLTRQSIIAIEKGRFIPSVQTALLLALALEARVDDLFWIEKEDSHEA